jgi:hypothetical protein
MYVNFWLLTRKDKCCTQLPIYSIRIHVYICMLLQYVAIHVQQYIVYVMLHAEEVHVYRAFLLHIEIFKNTYSEDNELKQQKKKKCCFLQKVMQKSQ